MCYTNLLQILGQFGQKTLGPRINDSLNTELYSPSKTKLCETTKIENEGVDGEFPGVF